jgi:signal peptidase II
MRFDFLLFSLVLAADRIFKIVIPSHLDLHRSLPVIPGFFQITYVRNSGGAFGILGSWDSPYRRLFFVLASIAALVLLFILYRQVARSGSRFATYAVILLTVP